MNGAERFLSALRGGRTLLLDGAMGTQLVARGVESGAMSNITAPDAVASIHRSYREAGADIIITNTFSANPIALARAGHASAFEEIVAAACRLAGEAGDGFLAGDIGPTGEYLEPYGDLTAEEMESAFGRIAEALAEGGVDLLLIETMSDAAEMRTAVRACRKVGLPVAASMAFDAVRDGFRTNSGVSPEGAVEAMSEADIIGMNCGAVSPEAAAEIVSTLRNVTDKPILAQPNAGLPEMVEGEVTYRVAPERFAEAMLKVRDAGASLLGGCCGTGPEHIKALRAALVRGTG